MFNFLKPTFYFHSIHDVDMGFYKDNGIKAVLSGVSGSVTVFGRIGE